MEMNDTWVKIILKERDVEEFRIEHSNCEWIAPNFDDHIKLVYSSINSLLCLGMKFEDIEKRSLYIGTRKEIIDDYIDKYMIHDRKYERKEIYELFGILRKKPMRFLLAYEIITDKYNAELLFEELYDYASIKFSSSKSSDEFSLVSRDYFVITFECAKILLYAGIGTKTASIVKSIMDTKNIDHRMLAIMLSKIYAKNKVIFED